MPAYKAFLDRLVELVKEDKELHDAVVRLIDAHAKLTQAQANRVKTLGKKLKKKR